MRQVYRIALSVLGIAVFVIGWHCGALLNGTERRVEVFGIAPDGPSRAVVVVVDRDRNTVATETVGLDAASRSASVETIRVLWGEHQPKFAAVPHGREIDGTAMLEILETAKREFGGGLIVDVVSGGSGASGAAERARLLQNERRIVSRDIPTPREALMALVEMTKSGTLLRYIIASLFRVAAGFALAVVVGVPFGLAFGSFAWVSGLTNALIQVLRPISPIAWLPVATIVFGGGDQAAVYLIFYCAVFPIVISTAAAIAAVDLKYRRSAMNFDVHGIDFARRVLLPAALPQILTALRVTIGIAWLVVVAAEMLGVESGLGFLVLDARNQTRYDRVVGAMIVIGAIGLVIDLSMRYFEKTELARRGLDVR